MTEIRTGEFVDCDTRSLAICRFMKAIQFLTWNISSRRCWSSLVHWPGPCRPWAITIEFSLETQSFISVFNPVWTILKLLGVKFSCRAFLDDSIRMQRYFHTIPHRKNIKLTNSLASIEVSLIDGIVSDASMGSGTFWSPAMKKLLYIVISNRLRISFSLYKLISARSTFIMVHWSRW